MLTVGLIVNPVAGMGGPAAQKGSDGARAQARAAAGGYVSPSHARTRAALAAMGKARCGVNWLTWGGAMGARALAGLVPRFRVLGHPPTTTTDEDTRQAARCLLEQGADLLVFSGGDGTARALLDPVHAHARDDVDVPVIGIPTGVKMHSGVFATSPRLAGELLARLVAGGLVRAVSADVRDQDEDALRSGGAQLRFYGELWVPEQGGYLQHTKEGGRENEELAVQEIVADIVARLEQPAIIGPGSTCAAIKRALGIEPTLLGFDAYVPAGPQSRDLDRRQIDAWAAAQTQPPVVILSFTRGQGFLLGRGNQQLSAELLLRTGRDGLWVVGTRTKLASLQGRPLLIDHDDARVNAALCGLVRLTAGYEDYLWHRLSDRL